MGRPQGAREPNGVRRKVVGRTKAEVRDKLKALHREMDSHVRSRPRADSSDTNVCRSSLGTHESPSPAASVIFRNCLRTL
jgi:predicted HAD superfamily Cof-like phosphohydrolase